jgi:hypothetical protein
MGFRARVARNTLANANATRDWRIYSGLAQALIRRARQLYADEPFGVELARTAYALDATTINLCLSVFPWAPFRAREAAIKVHTLLDLRGNIPSFVRISRANVHDVKVMDELVPEPGAFYVLDRAYLDFARLGRFAGGGAFFVTRARRDLRVRRQSARPVDPSTGVLVDQTVKLTWFYSRKGFPAPLRLIRFHDPTTGKRLVFLTNHFDLPAVSVAQLYRARWQIELFFKWIKQHLRITRFFGTSENAVKTQIWIAIATYVLIALIRKRLRLSASLYEILQVLSLTMFETTPLSQLLTFSTTREPTDIANQLILFD